MAYEESQLNSQWLDTKDDILRLLGMALHQHALLSVYAEQASEKLHALITDIDMERGLFQLDAAWPSTASLPTEIRASYITAQGIHAHFATTPEWPQPSADQLTLRIPSELRYHQRRDTFRIDTKHRPGLQLVITLPDGKEISAGLIDLSIQGFQASFAHQDIERLKHQPKSTPYLLRIAEHSLEAGITLLTQGRASHKGKSVVRARLDTTNTRSRDRLNHILALLQRETLRARKRERQPYHSR